MSSGDLGGISAGRHLREVAFNHRVEAIRVAALHSRRHPAEIELHQDDLPRNRTERMFGPPQDQCR